MVAQVKVLQKTTKDLQDKAADFNRKQGLFGDEVADYKQVYDMSRELQPYARMWLQSHDWVSRFQCWSQDPFDSLDPEEVERTHTATLKEMVTLSKVFKEKPHMLKIVDEIKRQADEFRPMVPIIASLRNPGMKDRHWAALSEKLDMEIRPHETLATLADVYPLVPSKEIIVRSCEVAAKEWDIESKLQDLAAQWEAKEMVIEEYKATKTYVLRQSDDIQTLLDEHLNVIQQLSFSPFKMYFAEQIDKWEFNMGLMMEILEYWLEVQRTWLYLEPIFSSEDIVLQLPALSNRFSKVNATWRKIMGIAHNTPNALSFCTNTSKLLDQLRDACRSLELVQKGLQDYLGDKRQVFARFYFLSDEELLEILSQAKDPHGMQLHLKKIFEFMDRMVFDEETDSQLVRFVSSEGESVPFKAPINPHGNIEEWLGLVQKGMKTALRHQLGLALEDLNQRERIEWVLQWPGQVVIAIGQVVWTAECEESLIESGSSELQASTLPLGLCPPPPYP